MILDITKTPGFIPAFPIISSSSRKKFNKIFVTSGMCPHPQVADGIYHIRHNQIQIRVRNGNKKSLKIGTNQRIKGIHGHTLNFIQLHLQNTNHSHDPLCSDLEQWHFISKTYIRMIALQDKNNQYNEVSVDGKSINGSDNVTCNVCQNVDTNFCECPEEATFNK
jgi:hypothetical protein